MKVLSLFDGMSCGQIVLQKLNIEVDKYYASEIKKHAIEVTQYNYQNTIQLGDITKIDGTQLEIDLLIGGSPCQDFSAANKTRDGLNGEKSRLFYEFIRLLKETKPKYFLLENVKMKKEWEDVITDTLKEIYPDTQVYNINSKLVSAQLRNRFYWTNIQGVTQPEDRGIKLQDILESGYTKKIKHSCLNTKSGANGSQEYMLHRASTTGMTTLIYNTPDFKDDNGVRWCTQAEMELLQNVPIGYTGILNKQKAGDLLGDGWTVDVVAHILSFIPR
jgi:DNA (cytosine-5)-methyltransferase 3A